MFDAREYLATLEPPQFTAPNGRIFVGRILSYPQFLPLQARMNEIGRSQLTHDKLYAAAKELTNAMFPKPWWMFWRRSCAYYVLRLPPLGVLRALQSFTGALAPVLGLTLDEAPQLEVDESRQVS